MTNVQGGLQLFPSKQVPALIKATDDFGVNNKDKKAQVILTINQGAGPVGGLLLSLYDGPKAAAEKAFAPFNKIKPQPLIDTRREQSFASFSKSTPSQLQGGARGAFHTMMTTKLTTNFMNAVHNESAYYAANSGLLKLKDAGAFYSYDLEPFDPDYGQFAQDSAFPHDTSPLPLNLYWGWRSAANDAHFRKEMVASVERLTKVARDEGIFPEGQPVYPNYALARYQGKQLYGQNTARLRKIRDQIDPDRIMELAGGFVI